MVNVTITWSPALPDRLRLALPRELLCSVRPLALIRAPMTGSPASVTLMLNRLDPWEVTDIEADRTGSERRLVSVTSSRQRLPLQTPRPPG